MAALSELNPDNSHPRRWTLRAKLIALVVAVAAVALIAIDVVLPLTIRQSMISERDSTLESVIGTLPPHLDLSSLDQLTGADSTRRTEIGWSLSTPGGPAKVVTTPARFPDANPYVGPEPPVGEPATIPDASSTDISYRALAVRGTTLGGTPAYLVAWVPLADVSRTVRQVLLLELLITGGVLVLLGSTAGLIIRRELKPLEKMVTAAGVIAAGDLDRRVDNQDPDTEIGRLGVAFNGMLDAIQDLIDERERSEDKLRQFLADAGHELRTPVAAVQGYTDLYRAGALPDAAAVDRAVDRMGFEARRMGALVEDLLTLVKADSREQRAVEAVNLSDLLTGVVDDAAVIDPTRTWRLSGAGRQVTVGGDRMRLHQLFANLLANVRTHTPEGTTVTVSILPAADRVAVSVADNGPGVSDADLPRLFDRFYRSDPSRSRANGGTGLGLSIVAAIVRGHGGEVLAGHTPGGGLTITVVLPRAIGTAAVPKTESKVVEPTPETAGNPSATTGAELSQRPLQSRSSQ